MPLIQFTPLIILYALSVIVLIFLAYRTWQLRPARGATYWTINLVFTTIFVVASGLEITVVDIRLKLLMIRFIYLGLAGFSIFYILFSMSYSSNDHLIKPSNIICLSIIPLLTLILVIFIDHHQLIYRDFAIVEAYGIQLFDVIEYGTFFYIWAGYSYIIIFSGAYLLIGTVWRSPYLFKGQAIMVILSVFSVVGIGTIYMFGYNPVDPIDPSPFSITIAGVFMFFSMVRFKFLEVSPIAQDVIFNSVNSAIVIIDTEQKIINMNHQAETLLKHDLKQSIGVAITELLDTMSISVPSIHMVNNDDSVIKIQDYYYELRVTPLHNIGRANGHILMFYDIDERLKMEQQTLELSIQQERIQFLKQFINDASHDFKTPISILKTNLYLMRRKNKFLDKNRLDVMELQMERLNRLVDDMLLLVRLEDNDIEKETLSINTLMDTVINIEQNKDNNIQFIPLKEDITLSIEQLELTRAFTNIIDNALNFTMPNDTITISIERVPHAIQVSIQDTGEGISPESLPFIFDRFYRVDPSRSMTNGGSGLGLAITKRIIERHDGTISVTSELGIGTKFIVTLPIIEQIPIPQ